MLLSQRETVRIELVLVNLGLIGSLLDESLDDVHVAFLCCVVQHRSSFGVDGANPVFARQLATIHQHGQLFGERVEFNTFLLF